MAETERPARAARVDMHVMTVRPADRSEEDPGEIPSSPEVGRASAGLEVVVLEQPVNLLVSLRVWLDVGRKSEAAVRPLPGQNQVSAETRTNVVCRFDARVAAIVPNVERPL